MGSQNLITPTLSQRITRVLAACDQPTECRIEGTRQVELSPRIPRRSRFRSEDRAWTTGLRMRGDRQNRDLTLPRSVVPKNAIRGCCALLNVGFPDVFSASALETFILVGLQAGIARAVEFEQAERLAGRLQALGEPAVLGERGEIALRLRREENRERRHRTATRRSDRRPRTPRTIRHG